MAVPAILNVFLRIVAVIALGAVVFVGVSQPVPDFVTPKSELGVVQRFSGLPSVLGLDGGGFGNYSAFWNDIDSIGYYTGLFKNSSGLVVDTDLFVNGTLYASVSETDPFFVSSVAANISASNVSNWNTAFGWGNHASAGYISDGNSGWDNLYGFISTGGEQDQVFVLDNATLWSAINNKLAVSDQRYNESSTLLLVNSSLSSRADALNSSKFDKSGGIISGSVQVNGNLSVVGSTVTLNVSTQVLNGSFLPSLNQTFDVGSNEKKWGALYVGNVFGFLNASFVANPPWLTSYLESDPIFLADNASLWSAINNRLTLTDQRYNETGLVVVVNGTVNALVANNNTIFIRQSADNNTIATRISSLLTNDSNLDGRITSLNNSLNNSKAGIGNCASGTVVANVTNGGVLCVTDLTGAAVDLWSGNLTTLNSANVSVNLRIDAVNVTQRADNSTLKALIDTKTTDVYSANISKLLTNDSNLDGRITTLNATQRADNSTLKTLIDTKALPGTCAPGTVTANVTTGGVQCVADASGGGGGNPSSAAGWTNTSLATSTSLNVTITAPLNVSGYNISANYLFASLNWSWLVNIPSYVLNWDAQIVANNTELSNRLIAVNSTANTKALPGLCAPGTVVANTTASGVQCVADLTGVGTDLWSGNITKLLTNDSNIDGRITTLNVTQRADNLTLKALIDTKAGTGTCAPGTITANVTTGGIQCVADIQGSGSFSYANYFDQFVNKSSNVNFVNVNASGVLISPTLKVASCDVKAYNENGSLYCGTDATGSFSGLINSTQINVSGTPVNGSVLTYVQNTGQFSWGLRSQVMNVTNSNFTTTSNAAFNIVENLSIRLEANTVYSVVCNILHTTNVTTSGTQFQFTYTGLPVYAYQTCKQQLVQATNSWESGAVGVVHTCSGTGTPTANSPSWTMYIGIIKTGATNQSFTVGSKVETGVAITKVLEGSYCKIE